MPKLTGTLTKQQNASLQEIVNNLRVLQPQAQTILEKQMRHKAQLEKASSWESFFEIVEEITNSATDADNILQMITENIDSKVAEALTEYLSVDAELMSIWSAFIFSQSMPDCIRATKERLSEKDLYEKFSGEKREMLRKFLEGIEVIKPIADVLKQQRELFRKELRDCSSIEDVNTVENKITAHDRAASIIYKKEIVYPSDDTVAGALIEYLEKNPQVQETLSSFDLSESLVDAVLDAKMRLSSNNASCGI